jgi:hypothetical protein
VVFRQMSDSIQAHGSYLNYLDLGTQESLKRENSLLELLKLLIRENRGNLGE